MFGLVPPTIPRPTLRFSKGKKANDSLERALSVEFSTLVFFKNQIIFCTTVCSWAG